MKKKRMKTQVQLVEKLTKEIDEELKPETVYENEEDASRENMTL
jgi:hypothetical protein